MLSPEHPSDTPSAQPTSDERQAVIREALQAEFAARGLDGGKTPSTQPTSVEQMQRELEGARSVLVHPSDDPKAQIPTIVREGLKEITGDPRIKKINEDLKGFKSALN